MSAGRLPLFVLLSCFLAPTYRAHADNEPSGNGTLQEVVVTSERASAENLQQAPAAITAISGDTLQQVGVTDTEGLSKLVPSARFSLEPGLIQLFIRGVGTAIDAPAITDPVGMNFNDVNIPHFTSDIPLFDVSDVEVLPGPQGTLYGAGALGGVVNISSNEPSHGYLADGVLEVGNYSTVHFTGVLNAPLSDSLAIRMAVNTMAHDGYMTNGTDTEHSEAARLSALYTPGDVFSLLVWGEYYINHAVPQTFAYYPYLHPDNPWDQPIYDPNAFSVAFYPPNGFNNTTAFGRYELSIESARAQWKLNRLKITYTPSFLQAPRNSMVTLAGFPVPNISTIHQETQDLRLVGDPVGAFSYLGGLYWYRNRTSYYSYLGPYLAGYLMPANIATGYAAYGQGTLAMRPTLRLTAGVRYSSDREYANHSYTVYPVGPTFAEGLAPYNAHGNWTNVDWKVGLQFDLAAHSMVYGNVQTGYDPGGYNIEPIAVAGIPLSKQTMLGYTVGTKNRLFDGRFQLNDEMYYYNYKNYLLTALSSGITYSFNVPKSRVIGNDLTAIYAVGPGTQINVGVGLLSAQIRQFSVNEISYAGYALPFAPQLTVSAGLQQNWTIPNGSSVTARVNTNFENGYWGIYDHSAGLHQGAYTMTDVSFTYYSASDHWDIGLWARNLENSAPFGVDGATGFPAPYGAGAYISSPPRTFGVRIHAKWGE